MSNQLLTDPAALRMFFTETVFMPRHNGEQSNDAAARHNGEQSDEATTVTTRTQDEAATATEEYAYIGKNKRNILLLVNDPQNQISTPQGTELLRNIVKHLQFDKDDFALVNLAKYPDASFISLKTFFQCKSLLAFGLSAAQIGLNEDTAAYSVLGDCRLLFGPDLGLMADSIDLKKQYWGLLKTAGQW